MIVLNDDHNTFDGVASALARIVPGLTLDQGYRLADKIHNTGQAIVWSGTRELAVTDTGGRASFTNMSIGSAVIIYRADGSVQYYEEFGRSLLGSVLTVSTSQRLLRDFRSRSSSPGTPPALFHPRRP